MRTGKNNLLLLIAGLLFVTSVSADSLIHDHISEEETSIECQYNENKTVDTNAPSLISCFLTTANSVSQPIPTTNTVM